MYIIQDSNEPHGRVLHWYCPVLARQHELLGTPCSADATAREFDALPPVGRHFCLILSHILAFVQPMRTHTHQDILWDQILQPHDSVIKWSYTALFLVFILGNHLAVLQTKDKIILFRNEYHWVDPNITVHTQRFSNNQPWLREVPNLQVAVRTHCEQHIADNLHVGDGAGVLCALGLVLVHGRQVHALDLPVETAAEQELLEDQEGFDLEVLWDFFEDFTWG